MNKKQRFSRIKSIFMTACDLPADERDQYVRNECGDDLKLFEEVYELLEHHQDATISYQGSTESDDDATAETFIAAPDLDATSISGSNEADNELSFGLPHGESELDSGARYFGVYELLNEIARGGMGVVYKARQSTLNRIVAIKMILGGQLASKEQVQRFLVEAEAAANLNHPGIVPVYEFGEREGTHYFSMAFVDGPSLAAYVSDNSLPPNEAAELVLKVSAAIAYAHQHGVIHRDLKPANILLDQGTEPRITDFGLAKRLEDDSELTKTGAIMGSVYYMPPEQAAGKTEEVGPAADIYALGAVLYKLLTGRPPFQAPTPIETIRQVISHEPVQPRRLNPRIPQDLETICLKCLEKDPDRRYGSATELNEELQRFLKGEPILARPISRAAILWRWCRRNPVTASLTAGLVAASFIGIFTATSLWEQAQSEHRRAQDQLQKVEVLSDMIINKTLDATEEWLKSFFEPVEQELLVARSWGEKGLLDTDRPENLNDVLMPLITHYPQTSSIMVADSRGREQMLLSIDPQRTTTELIHQQWNCRITRRDEWEDRVQWLTWSGDQQDVESTFKELPDYDPRQRPWYTGAVTKQKSMHSLETSAALSNKINWTSPYVFFTTKDLGITASITYDHGDKLTHVVAFDVLLQDISRFTTNRHPTQGGKVLIVTDEEQLIGLPHDPTLKTLDQWKEAFLKRPSELALDVISDAARIFVNAPDESIRVRKFQSGGQIWWAGVRKFPLGQDQVFWILVVIPEMDLHKGFNGPEE